MSDVTAIHPAIPRALDAYLSAASLAAKARAARDRNEGLLLATLAEAARIAAEAALGEIAIDDDGRS